MGNIPDSSAVREESGTETTRRALFGGEWPGDEAKRLHGVNYNRGSASGTQPAGEGQW